MGEDVHVEVKVEDCAGFSEVRQKARVEVAVDAHVLKTKLFIVEDHCPVNLR